MNEDEAQSWIDFLDKQLAFFYGEMCVVSPGAGVVDSDLIAFLQVPDQSVPAIEEFIRTERWPLLKAAEIRSLYHRATLAKGVLLAMVNREPMPTGMVIPNASDRPQVLQWLFIYIWTAASPAYLKAISPAFGR